MPRKYVAGDSFRHRRARGAVIVWCSTSVRESQNTGCRLPRGVSVAGGRSVSANEAHYEPGHGDDAEANPGAHGVGGEVPDAQQPEERRE